MALVSRPAILASRDPGGQCTQLDRRCGKTAATRWRAFKARASPKAMSSAAYRAISRSTARSGLSAPPSAIEGSVACRRRHAACPLSSARRFDPHLWASPKPPPARRSRVRPNRDYSGLTWRLRPNVQRPGRGRSVLDDVLIRVVALRAFEGSQIEPGFGRLDACQDHRSPALGTGLWPGFDDFAQRICLSSRACRHRPPFPVDAIALLAPIAPPVIGQYCSPGPKKLAGIGRRRTTRSALMDDPTSARLRRRPKLAQEPSQCIG